MPPTSYLRSHNEWPQRDQSWGYAKRHRNANLAALGLYHAGGQIEGGKDGADEDGEGDDIRRLLIALNILRDGAINGIIDILCDGGADLWQLRLQRLFQLRDDGFPGNTSSQMRISASSTIPGLSAMACTVSSDVKMAA